MIHNLDLNDCMYLPGGVCGILSSNDSYHDRVHYVYKNAAEVSL